MKRFYKNAAVQPCENGYNIALDGRTIRTPAKVTLAVPTNALANAIADEWNAQGDAVQPRTMPLTGLANAAMDKVAPDTAKFAADISVYAESDLLAYRAEHPTDLIARQNAQWNPIIDWAKSRFDIPFHITSGIIHKPQPEEALERLRAVVAAYTPFELAGLHVLVTISGSLLIGLALFEQAIDVETAWTTGHLDELWQVEKWGEDDFALKSRNVRRQDFDSGARFLELLRQA